MLVLGISVEGKKGLAVTIHSPGEAFAGKGGEVDLWDTLSDFSTCRTWDCPKVRHTVDIFSIIQKHAIVHKSKH